MYVFRSLLVVQTTSEVTMTKSILEVTMEFRKQRGNKLYDLRLKPKPILKALSKFTGINVSKKCNLITTYMTEGVKNLEGLQIF